MPAPFTFRITEDAHPAAARAHILRECAALGLPPRACLWAAAAGAVLAGHARRRGRNAVLSITPHAGQTVPDIRIEAAAGVFTDAPLPGDEDGLVSRTADGAAVSLHPAAHERRATGTIETAETRTKDAKARDADEAQEVLRLFADLALLREGIAPLHDELAERNGQLRQANEIRARFLSHMTHEFRTPVNSILSLTRFLLDRTDGELTEEQERQISLIRKSSERLSGMINDLLDLARTEANHIALSCAPCDADGILRALEGMFAPLVGGQGLLLRFEAAPGIPPLHSDRERIIQILRQLVSNAIKYTGMGNIDVAARAGADGKTVVFTVADTGPGIAAEDHERIFEYMAPVSPVAESRNRGSGLGLPLARKLTERMGGTITLDSRPQEGARFTVTLPLRLEDAGDTGDAVADAAGTGRETSPAPTATHAAPPGNGVPARPAILILDDEEVSYYMLKRVLKDEGYEVHEAATYDKAVALARRHRPGAVFIDMMMPQMTGLEAMAMLRREEDMPPSRVILHSHKELTDEEKTQLPADIHDILPKDIAYEDLQSYVRNLKALLVNAS